MKTAIYLRVSTSSQDTEMQRTDLTNYCKTYGLPFDIFEEKMSGSKADNRPELQKLMSLARDKKYDRLLIWKLDRLGRSVRDLANIIAELDSCKCALVSFKESLDLATPTGRLMVSLLSSFAEFELAMLKERQRAGIAHAKSQGVRFGSLPIYSREAVRSERAKGYTWDEVAVNLGISRATVYRIAHSFKKKAENKESWV